MHLLLIAGWHEHRHHLKDVHPTMKAVPPSRHRHVTGLGQERRAHDPRTLSRGGFCPSCGEKMQRSSAKHMAFCCPDLLDPDGWHNMDYDVVMTHARQSLRKGSLQAEVIRQRFGRRGHPPTQQQICQSMGLAPRRVRDVIAGFLHSIPPPPEHEPVCILFEDRDVVAVNKPAGLPVTPFHR